MPKAKKAVFIDEEATNIEKILEDVIDMPSEDEEINKMFSGEPFKVEEVIKRDDKIDVIPLRDYSFSFGGTWYHLQKGKIQSVPEAVRDFLLKNKINPKIKDIW